jgi:hypothetical protein
MRPRSANVFSGQPDAAGLLWRSDRGSDMNGPTATMNNALKPFREFASVDEGCAELGRFLGLPGPASKDIFASALEDDTYARNLIISRRSPAFLKMLLEHPPRRFSEPAPGGSVKGPSNLALLSKASRSLWAWARSGLETVSEETYRLRLASCDACPHFAAAPDRAVYRMTAKANGNDARTICSLCGCVTATKARMATESCPGDDPNKPGFTRWGEPRLTRPPNQ